MSTPCLRIHPKDSVAVALETLSAGTRIDLDDIHVTALETIPKGHKVALRDLSADEPVIKYGFPIGNTTQPVPAGAWVHTHNVKTGLSGTLDYTYHPQLTPYPDFPEGQEATFDGYLRPDGSVATRNELWVIVTVACVNEIARRIVEEARQRYGHLVDGIHTFVHPYGCSQIGDDMKMTQTLLADLVSHPNAGGVLVLSLGCENNHLGVFKPLLGDYDPARVRFLIAQEVEDEVKEGVRLLGELAAYASAFHRQPLPVSKLCIGLKCGGSDGFSGLTANPLLGAFSDRMGACGASTVLCEVPEMFGAETILMDHCENEAVFDQTVSLINNFKDYFIEHGQVIYENPSPGNKEGGITTLEEKSLGCTQKGGRGTVRDVLRLGETVRRPGLSLLQSPGNDVVACTALSCAHVHLILFTTGRGTPYGGPVTTVKIATNSEMAQRKKKWIDYDAGVLLENPDLDAISLDFFHYILDVASGRRVRTEENNFHDLGLFKDGVTL